MYWKPPKIWDGGTALILAGGPSLESQWKNGLPHKIKTARDSGVRVIGVNNALHLDWGLIDVIWFGDSRWLFWHFEKVKAFPGVKASCCVKFAGKLKWLKVMARDKPQGIETKEGYVSWNRSSGSSAVNLAYHLGAKKIILFGFDMKASKTEDGIKTNWLPHPRQKVNKKKQEAGYTPYPRFSEPWVKIMKDAKELGIEILNASPGSALKEKPYNVPEVDWKDVL